MLTGDNPLTACHVAKELKIARRKVLVLTKDEGTGGWAWQNVRGDITVALETKPSELGEKYDLCLTGDVSHYSPPLSCVPVCSVCSAVGAELCAGRAGRLPCHPALRQDLCTSRSKAEGVLYSNIHVHVHVECGCTQ